MAVRFVVLQIRREVVVFGSVLNWASLECWGVIAFGSRSMLKLGVIQHCCDATALALWCV